ncbi:MAG: DNA translocase FtsK [Chloroflexi bacterium]|nr:DNA translocase FtsK [Chloroflexota bacterium]
MKTLWHIITSPWTPRLLPLLITGGLILGYWDEARQALGATVFLPILLAFILGVLIWRRTIPTFLHPWHRWFGIAAFLVALLGILAFSGPVREGFLDGAPSLGGEWGLTIIARQVGEPISGGIFIAIAIVLVGFIFMFPRLSWRAVRAIAGGIVALLRWLGKQWQEAVQALRQFGQHHPVRVEVPPRLKKTRSPRAPARPLPEPSGDAEPSADTAPDREQHTADHSDSERRAASPVETGSPELVGTSTAQWQMPRIELLNETAKSHLSQTEVDKRARLIEEALSSYGVEAKVVQTNIGPSVTQFGVEPGWDRKTQDVKVKDKNGNVKTVTEETSRTRVKVERINSLANDLALALAATSIRIEAPVPGTSLVGIEVPNSSMGTVSVREVLESGVFQRTGSRSKLTVALGKGTSGELFAADLAKMPHMLIAGATGSGKTVCLDSIIVSLLMYNTPDNLRFVMIDPKRVELITFNGVPHQLTPVVTEAERAVDMLKWVEHEMDNRYRKLASVAIHNIERYNKSPKVPRQMPYLVVIVDELADLMLAKSDEVEPLLCRLAQMGRAVGIHLVVATQRPSVDVITGLIKANFPTRISFAVVSQVDSRTILDSVGAEKLLGKGDMLFHSAEMAKPKRLQGCFISPEEMERIVSFWRKQARSQVADMLSASAAMESDEDDTSRSRLPSCSGN